MPGYWARRLAAASFIVFSLYIGNMALEFPAGGGTFPLFAAICAILLSALMIAGTFGAAKADLAGKIRFDFSYTKMKPLYLAVLSVVYVLAMFELGYFTASILFLFIAVWMVGVRNLRAIALTAIILFPLMYGFFIVFLQANLPKGILF